MPSELSLLTLTAAGIAFLHTVAGPDHYLPFIVMLRLGRWSMLKTAWITLLCGLGHVLSSVVLGLAGIALGIALAKLQAIEYFRGDLAARLLTAFGLVYCVWGVRRAYRNRPHTHGHVHLDGHRHEHEHVHTHAHTHVHASEAAGNMTPWVLFTIFVFGRCEVLIPLATYTAAGTPAGAAPVTTVFGVITISTMLTLVLTAAYSGRAIRWEGSSATTTPGRRRHLRLGVSIQCLGL